VKYFPCFVQYALEPRQEKKEAKGRPSTLLTSVMNVHAQIDLINYQSMPDGSYNYMLGYQDHVLKFCQLCSLRQRTYKAVAIELINIFCTFGQLSILQADNGMESSHGAATRHIQLDEEVSISCVTILFLHGK